MPKKAHGLGRGLDVLLPMEDLPQTGSLSISIGDIDPDPDQPRRSFQEESIEQLASSIREHGVLQPVLVVPTENGRYRLVAGERRWRAARAAGLETIPCIVRDLDAVQKMEISLIENLQREDLNPMDAAQGIRALMLQCGYTQEVVAQRLGKSRPAVANLLRLLTLPDEVTGYIRQGLLSAGHARVLAGLESKERQLALARETLEKGYSVRELETIAATQKAAAPAVTAQPRRKAPLAPELTELQEKVQECFGMKAVLTGTEKKGRIVLQYRSRDELEHLYELLESMREGNEGDVRHV